METQNSTLSAASSDGKHSAWATFTSPLRQSKAFTLLWLGHWIAMLGSSVTTVILPLVIYSLTGSTTIMGLAMTVYMLPNVLILPFAGMIVDRIDRIRLLLFANIARFGLMFVAAVLMFTDGMKMPFLFVGLALYGLMDGIFNPAYSALRAQVFTPDIRNAANALSQISIQAVRLLGPPLGGFIVSFASPGIGFGLDSITYLISFACFWMLSAYLASIIGKRQADPEQRDQGRQHFLRDFIAGFAILKSHPWLWITILAFSFINICYSGIIAVLIPWLFKVHHSFSPVVYGVAMASSGVGAMMGAFVYGSRKHWKHRGLLAYLGALVSGFALLLFSIVTWMPGLIMSMMLEGFGIMIFAIIWETSLQELVPAESFGRVASLDLMFSFALLPVGYLAVGAVADKLGGIFTIGMFAAIGMCIVLGVLCIPHIRRFQ
ncbi:MFS transporter [Paenibacillus sp. BJ-4]|uniref:MFS transporter n=1 Tax=Paenibacillus sp. BJ-4 TaxID=2878097 RepID=UPI001CF00592|nr:MFS transporter [Paenibacillus sp. BJ-4]